MATTLQSAAGAETSAVTVIETLTSTLQTEEALLSTLRDRGTSIESEITSLRDERTELLCKLADAGNGADVRTKIQKRLDTVDERLRNLEASKRDCGCSLQSQTRRLALCATSWRKAGARRRRNSARLACASSGPKPAACSHFSSSIMSS